MNDEGVKMKKNIDPLKFRKIQFRIEENKKNDKKQLQSEAFDKAKTIATLLKEKYNVKNVWVYGSVVQGDFHQRSDIDMLIDDTYKGSFWEMYVRAQRKATPFHLSLITEKDAFPSLIKFARKEGVRL